MSEPMTVRIEVWPLAADESGIWLASGGDAWRPDLPIDADGDIHAEVEAVLAVNGVGDTAVLLHSTSWRPEGPSTVLTYVAVLAVDGPVRRYWPHAQPLSPNLLDLVGTPPTHGATEVPIPRHLDVVLHAVRHIAFLLRTDGTAAAALDGNWRRHLAEFEPALARMYTEPHAA